MQDYVEELLEQAEIEYFNEIDDGSDDCEEAGYF